MSDTILYDKADWHSGGDFPGDLPPEAAATHIGIFLAWAITRGLASDLLKEDAADELDLVVGRQITPREAAERLIDGRLIDEDLSLEGNAFATAYYGTKGYYPDLATFSDDLDSIYHLPDTWATFDKIAPVLDTRYQAWKRPDLLSRFFRRD